MRSFLPNLVISLAVQLDGGERLDLGVLEFVDGGVHLGNDDGFVLLVLLTQLRNTESLI